MRSWLKDWCLIFRRKKRQRLHLVNFGVFFFSTLKGGYERFLVINGEKKRTIPTGFLFPLVSLFAQ